jgi:hypothetical protein
LHTRQPSATHLTRPHTPHSRRTVGIRRSGRGRGGRGSGTGGGSEQSCSGTPISGRQRQLGGSSGSNSAIGSSGRGGRRRRRLGPQGQVLHHRAHLGRLDGRGCTLVCTQRRTAADRPHVRHGHATAKTSRKSQQAHDVHAQRQQHTERRADIQHTHEVNRNKQEPLTANT